LFFGSRFIIFYFVCSFLVLLAAPTIFLTAYGLVYLFITFVCDLCFYIYFVLELFVGSILDNSLTSATLVVGTPIMEGTPLVEATPFLTDANLPLWNEKAGKFVDCV
jgi:hypothetical protein